MTRRRSLLLGPCLLAMLGWIGAGVQFEGRIVDATTGEGVEGAVVRLVRGGVQAVTDEEGHFHLGDPGLLADTLLIFHSGYGQVRIPIGSPEPRDWSLEIKVRQAPIRLYTGVGR